MITEWDYLKNTKWNSARWHNGTGLLVNTLLGKCMQQAKNRPRSDYINLRQETPRRTDSVDAKIHGVRRGESLNLQFVL